MLMDLSPSPGRGHKFGTRASVAGPHQPPPLINPRSTVTPYTDPLPVDGQDRMLGLASFRLIARAAATCAP